ncbi:MAG: CRISPR-associated endoribonuclease Cas6, partial [Thermoplasmatales archaeon]
ISTNCSNIMVQTSVLVIHLTISSNSTVPYDHQYELYSSVQSKIGMTDPNISHNIHESRGVPLFNMSSLLPIGFEGKPIWPNARLFALYINTTRQDVADTILAALKVGTQLTLNSCMLNLVSIDRGTVAMEHPPVTPELRCRGPIVIREKGKYFRVGDDGFESRLIAALKRKSDAVTGRDTIVRGLKITSAHKKRYTVAGHGIPASILSFILDADEDVIRTALTYGVGSKTQMGFGMVAVKEG